ncbi:MAG: hypothetical protein ABI723_16510 [Bacteroidia bacterium]
MVVGQLIKDTIPPLRLNDTGERALAWMDVFQIDQLPLLHGKNYLGLISRNALSHHVLKEKISTYELELPHPYVLNTQHIYDAFTFSANHEYVIIPVLDEQHHYVGLITALDLIAGFVQMKSLNTQGSIIVIEIKLKDFQLSHIIQVVESNESKVLNADVHIDTDMDMAEVTMKINRIDLSRIQAAFFRYNYNVKAIYHQVENTDDLQNRFDSLMHYLNI